MLAHRTRHLARVACAGGGQVWVEGTTLYVGHMRPPAGTSLFDVADPTRPRLLAEVPMPPGWHSRKVRTQGAIMLVNHEQLQGGAPDSSPTTRTRTGRRSRR